MSETAKEARAAMKAKAHRLASGDPHQRVDASGWTPPEQLESNVQTGERPISKRAFKRGGKVEGEHETKRADRKARKSGGSALTPNNLINRDVKAANEERDGPKHVGGFKRGGRPHKMDGGTSVPTSRLAFAPASSEMARAAGLKRGGKAHGDEPEDRKLIDKMVKRDARTGKKGGGMSVSNGEIEGTRPTGGRMAKAEGGPVGYHVVDRHTGQVIGRFKKGAAASSMINRKDNAYGAYRHSRVPIYADHPEAAHFTGGSQAPAASAPQASDMPLPRKAGGRADAHWIKGAIGDKGALHRSLHVPEGEKIPEKKLDKAEHSSNKMVAKRADLAATLRGFNHEGRKERQSGGRAGKGKMNVNIVIATGPRGDQGMPSNMDAPTPAPHPMPPPAPPQGMAPPPQMPQGAPPMGGPPPANMMPRKAGGRVPKIAREMADHGGGAGGGLGRLEKSRAYGDKAREVEQRR